MMNIAVILAGGMGTRIGGNTPKQLLPLADGRSVLEHSVAAFEQAQCIDEIGIVMHKDYLAEAEEMVRRNGWKKVAFVIAGGSERWESSVNAIREIERRTSIKTGAAQENSSLKTVATQENNSLKAAPSRINILLHDAARPFVSKQIIENVCQALEQHEAVTVAIPATDTMYTVAQNEEPSRTTADNGITTTDGTLSTNADQVVQDIPQRTTLMCAQTPQAFRLSTIANAYRLALQDTAASALHTAPHIPATDDCAIVHRYLPSVPIHIVLGSPSNRKITYKEDIPSE